jgi:DNA-binding transcriptional LysR family regulator
MKSKISLKQLQALEAVARLGSFTQAAKELGVSQPTVSNLIYAMAQHSQCRLLERAGNAVSPAPALDRIRGDVKALLALRDSIDHQLSEARALRTGRFQIGYSTYQIAMPLISQLVRNFPGIDVTARALASHDLLPLLHAGEFDVGLITAKELPGDLAGLEIAETRIGLVVPHGHPLAAQGSAAWADVAGLKLIQREPSSSTRRIFESAAQLARCPLTTVLGLGSWGSIRTLVTSGVGLGVAFEQECRDESGVTFVPIEDSNLMASHYMACLPAMRQTAVVERFFQIAAELDQAV